MPPDDRIIFAVVVRLVLTIAGLVNLFLAFREYSSHTDARGLRGFVAGLSFMFGVLAITGGSPAIRDAYPLLDRPMAWLTVIGTTGFCIGLLFSVYTWWLQRRSRIRTEAS